MENIQSIAQYFSWFYHLILSYLPNVVMTILIIILGVLSSKIIKKHIQKLLLTTSLDKTIAIVLSQVAYILMVVLIFLMALGTLGISTTPITGALAGILIGIGMSLKSSFNTIAAGIILMTTRPFKVGDSVDIGGTSGIVESIGFAFCILQTPDGNTVKIPNSVVTSKIITNPTNNDFSRNDITINVPNNIDVIKAKHVLKKLLDKELCVLKDANKKPVVRINKLTDTSVEVLIRYWTKRSNALETKWNLNELIKIELETKLGQ